MNTQVKKTVPFWTRQWPPAGSHAQIGEEGLSQDGGHGFLRRHDEQRKRTWAQPQELKKATRKDRGFFSSRTEARNRADGSRLPRQPPWLTATGRRRVSVPACVGKNRCFRCKKKGPWKAECPGTSPTAFSGLAFLHTVEEESDWPPGTAGQASIGEAACIRWSGS